MTGTKHRILHSVNLVLYLANKWILLSVSLVFHLAHRSIVFRVLKVTNNRHHNHLKQQQGSTIYDKIIFIISKVTKMSAFNVLEEFLKVLFLIMN